MIKRILLSLFTLCLFMTFPLHAGGSQEKPVVSRIITDAKGREVTIPADPTRIALAGRAVIMLADALYSFPGAAEKVVGVSNTDQGMGDFLELIDPELGEKFHWRTDVGAEQVLEAAPEVVILKGFMQEKLGDPLEKLGIPVVYLDLETPEQYERDIAILGALLAQKERAEELISFYRSEWEEVKSRAPAAGPDTLVLYYSDRGGSVSFQVPPRGWIQTTMTEIAGGRPVWLDSAVSPGWNRVGLEQISAWDPDRIFLISYRSSAADLVEELKNDPAWQNLRAVTNGALSPFPGDYYSWGQPDSRWILGLWWLSEKIGDTEAPDRAALEEKARRVFSFLYHMEEPALTTLIEKIR